MQSKNTVEGMWMLTLLLPKTGRNSAVSRGVQKPHCCLYIGGDHEHVILCFSDSLIAGLEVFVSKHTCSRSYWPAVPQLKNWPCPRFWDKTNPKGRQVSYLYKLNILLSGSLKRAWHIVHVNMKKVLPLSDSLLIGYISTWPTSEVRRTIFERIILFPSILWLLLIP